jgi:hypothetical protein
MSATPSTAETPIPTLADLQGLRRWTAWQAELPPGRKKPTKVPYRNPGAFSKADTPATWVSLDEARTVAELLPRPMGVGGIGIFLGALVGTGWHLVGIDYDSCIDGSGLVDWAAAGVASTNSYGEVSPSGEGVKQFMACRESDLPGIKAALGIAADKNGRRWSKAAADGGDHPPGIEVYLGGRYFTVTGDSAGLPGELTRLTIAAAETLVTTALPLLKPGASVTPPLRLVGAEDEDVPPPEFGASRDGVNDPDALVGDDAADRFALALKYCPPVNRLWTCDYSDLVNADSRSETAYRMAGRLYPMGFTREEARRIARACPGKLGEWMAEKGDPGDDGTGREWHNAWNNACKDKVYGARTAALPVVEGLSSRDPRPGGGDVAGGIEAGGEADGGAEGDVVGSASEAVAELVSEFNQRYMVVNEGGRALIYAPATDPILHRRFFERMDFADLKKLFMNRRVRVGKKEDGGWSYKPAAEVWLAHRNRRQYLDGVAFDPSGKDDRPGVLNLWQGFGVRVAEAGEPGSWALLRRHMLESLCGGSDDLLGYVLDWLARMVQQPASPGEVAVVMRGVEGTGKGTPARVVKRLLGQHGMAVSNAKHLTGNFNAHLRDCVFLFADEAFYAGDPSHVGVLKSLITEPYLTVEAKYANAVQSPNFLHVMMASNEEWVVPASLNARRFLVLEVSDTRVGDFAWFDALWAELEGRDAGGGGVDAGYSALLRDLLARDLSRFNVRAVPDTAGLQRQKMMSLTGADAWWLDVLHRGSVAPRMGLAAWQETMATDLLFDAYQAWSQERREYHPLNRVSFGRFMARMGCDGVRMAADREGKRPWGYWLGALAMARGRFDALTKLRTPWAPDGQTD